jgi:hypothetical protein
MLPDDQAALIVDQTVHLVNLRNGITKSVKMEHQLQILFIHREHLIGYVNPETNTLKFFNTVTMALEAMEVKLSGYNFSINTDNRVSNQICKSSPTSM